jgi:sugar fermentation stimulation protein A
MRFESPLSAGSLVRRYKRFLADVQLPDGSTITVHCPNSGSMKQCVGEGWPVRLSRSDNPKRKHAHTLEMTHNGTCWIGVNTQRPNQIVAESISAGLVPELVGYETLRREVPYGANSRVDILLEGTGPRCYVEVKNVTLVGEDGQYCFPDSVTSRGLKHLHELVAQVESGSRAVMFYLIQRSDGEGFRPAAEIDPAYAEGLCWALAHGVEAIAYRAEVSPEGIHLAEKVPVTV